MTWLYNCVTAPAFINSGSVGHLPGVDAASESELKSGIKTTQVQMRNGEPIYQNVPLRPPTASGSQPNLSGASDLLICLNLFIISAVEVRLFYFIIIFLLRFFRHS